MTNPATTRFPLAGQARTLVLIALSTLLLAGLGCRAQPWQGFPETIDPEFVWPLPPERPRVAYVMEIKSRDDLFTPSGGWKAFAEFIAGPPESRMIRPYALALHPAGGLLVTDPGRQIVHFYCWERRKYLTIGPKREGGLLSPVGVAALPDGRILVSDSRLNSIECFDRDGRWMGAFVATGQLGRPAGIAVDPQRGIVYVVDVTGHRIVMFDLEGRRVGVLGRRGENPGEFNFPTHLALSPEGNVIVADTMNFRIQILTPDGTPVRSIGRIGLAPGQFSRLKGLAVDGAGRVIAVEGLFDALEIFDSEGALLLHMGEPGSEPGQFWLPAGLAMDRKEGLLFVADSYNSRVQVFRFLDGKAAEIPR